MDKMYDSPTTAMPVINASLALLDKVRADNPISILLVVFFLAKSEELINLYTDAPQAERNKASTLLSKLDPINSEKYLAMTKKKN